MRRSLQLTLRALVSVIILASVSNMSARTFELPPQEPEMRPPDGSDSPGSRPPPMRPNHGPMDRAMHVGPPGRWWSDPTMAQSLGLSADQQNRMDAVFDGNRPKLIYLSAALQKEEAVLEPLLASERPDEAKILAQIDRVAQARAELEKGNARMLLGLRSVLTQEQWKKLRAEAPGRHGPPPPRF